jgi:hypothetical protein
VRVITVSTLIGLRDKANTSGSEGMHRILTYIKNHDLEQWLNSDFETSKLISLDRKKLQAAARDSFMKRTLEFNMER